MAVYDLEEQEQLDDLKAWWRRWGNTIIGRGDRRVRRVIAVQGWRWWTRQAGRRGRGAVRRRRAGGARERRAEGARTRWRSSPTSSAAPATRRARRCSCCEAAVRQRRQGGREGAAAMGHRPRRRGRAEAGRALPARRGRCSTRSSTTRRSRRSTRSTPSRSPGLYADLRGDALVGRRTHDGGARPRTRRRSRKLDAKSPYRNYVQVKLDSLPGRGARCAGRQRRRQRGRTACTGGRPQHAAPPAKGRRRSDRAASAFARRRGARGWRSRSRCPAAARCRRGCLFMVAAGPSFDWLTGRNAATKPGPLPELTATSTADRQLAGRRSARPRRASRPRSRPTRSTRRRATARSCASIPRRGRTVWRIAAGKRLSAGAGRGRNARRRRHRQGRRARVRPRRQAAVDGAGLERGDRAAGGEPKASSSCSSGDGRVFGLGAADGKTKWVHQRNNPPLTVRNTPAASSSRGGVFIGMPGGRLLALDLQTGSDRLGRRRRRRRRARPSSSASPTSPAAAAGRRSGRSARSRTRAASRASRSRAARSTGRATCRASTGIAADGAAHLRHRRQGRACTRSTRAPAPRCGSRTRSRSAGPAARRSSATTSPSIDIEGYVHLLSRGDGAYVGRLATDGSARDRRSPQLFAGERPRVPDRRRGNALRRRDARRSRRAASTDAHAAHRRPRRPPERRQVDAVQPAHADARRAGRRLPGPDPRPPLRPRRALGERAVPRRRHRRLRAGREDRHPERDGAADAAGDRRSRRRRVHRRRARRPDAAGRDIAELLRKSGRPGRCSP